MLYIFLGLIVAFLLWNANLKMLLILILLLVLFIAFYTTPLSRAFELFQEKDYDESEESEGEDHITIKRKTDSRGSSKEDVRTSE